MTRDEGLAEVQSVLQALARKFSRPGVVGLEYEDLVQEGAAFFLSHLWERYDGTSCRLSTFAYGALRNYFISQTHHKIRRACTGLDDVVGPVTEGLNYVSFIVQHDLGDDAAYIVNLIYNTPERLFGKRRRNFPRPSIKLVRNCLKDEGWTHTRAQNAMDQIVQALC